MLEESPVFRMMREYNEMAPFRQAAAVSAVCWN